MCCSYRETKNYHIKESTENLIKKNSIRLHELMKKSDIYETRKRNMNISIFAQNKYDNLCWVSFPPFCHIEQHNETCLLDNSYMLNVILHNFIFFSKTKIRKCDLTNILHTHIIRLNILFCGEHIMDALSHNDWSVRTHYTLIHVQREFWILDFIVHFVLYLHD